MDTFTTALVPLMFNILWFNYRITSRMLTKVIQNGCPSQVIGNLLYIDQI